MADLEKIYVIKKEVQTSQGKIPEVIRTFQEKRWKMTGNAVDKDGNFFEVLTPMDVENPVSFIGNSAEISIFFKEIEPNTGLSYIYLDYFHTRNSNRVVFKGILSEDQIEDIKERTNYGDGYFIPYDVGLPELQRECKHNDDRFPKEIYHILEDISLTFEEATETCTAEEFYQKWMKINGNWNEEMANSRILGV